MDRLRAMSNARRLFNGPLRKCSKAAAAEYRPWPVSSSSLQSSARQHAISAAAARAFSADASDPSSSGGSGGGGRRIVVESQFKPVDPINLTLPEYIWRNVDKWEDKPMIVSG